MAATYLLVQEYVRAFSPRDAESLSGAVCFFR
jgi:hypothetical protein